LSEAVKKDRARNIVLPKNDAHWKPVAGYANEPLDNDYIHAPEAAHEAFRDVKYSIRIHWGVYSIWKGEASYVGYQNTSPEQKMEYQQLYKQFNPTDFDADKWMDWFKRCGMQGFAFTSKHCDGFSMFHTKTKVKQRFDFVGEKLEDCDLHYSIEETPFKRDIVKELCDAAHRKGLKIDLYFSHPDDYDADFRAYQDFRPYSIGSVPQVSRTPEETKRMMERHREQLRELLSNYGKIDMVCLDMWLTKQVWDEMKKTIKMMRQIQPDVMIRARGIGSYGDYYQPEISYSKPAMPGDANYTAMPWMKIDLLGKTFAFDPDGNHYRGAAWVIHSLIDCVSSGGSFMVSIGPDEKGNFHPTAVKQLEEVGDWLKVNGKGIYETRARDVWKEDNLKFTRSKDNKTVYAFVEKFPEKELTVKSVTPKKKSEVKLLGYDKPLKWSFANGSGVRIEIPDALQSPENRPCEYAWVFRIENGDFK
jgi:alpha-L-fucosidase